MKVFIENKLILVKWKHINNQQTNKELPSYTECLIESKEEEFPGYLPAFAKTKVSPNDNYNKSIGRKLSLTKALKNSGFDKETRKIFWEFYKMEFNGK